MDNTDYKHYKKILLFFSGGLDTSFLLKWFTFELGCEVIVVTFDLGGDKIETAKIKQRAKLLGAKQHIVVDAKKEFVEEYCWKAVRANAVFAGAHPLSSSLSRPLMAKLGVALAKKHGCTAIIHGSNGWQNNSARFDTAIRVLAEDIEIIEPIMEQNVSREFEYEYLKSKGVKIEKKEDNLLSSDNNMWGREVEDGVLENPYHEPRNGIYRLTSAAERAPKNPEYVTIDFCSGIPTKINGKKLEPRQLVEKLNAIGGKHGVGRHDAMEDKIIGYKMREIHESPAATILLTAHRDLENTVLPRKTIAMKRILDAEWTDLACFGLWYHPLRTEIEAFINKVSERVSGTVRVKLYKGSVQIVGRESKHGLYQKNIKGKIEKSFKRSPSPGRNFYDYYLYEAKICQLTE